MNEKIKEFERASSTVVWQDEKSGYVNFDREKFAESIVQECVSVLKKRYMGDLNREDAEVLRCIEAVKNHFGIK